MYLSHKTDEKLCHLDQYRPEANSKEEHFLFGTGKIDDDGGYGTQHEDDVQNLTCPGSASVARSEAFTAPAALALLKGFFNQFVNFVAFHWADDYLSLKAALISATSSSFTSMVFTLNLPKRRCSPAPSLVMASASVIHSSAIMRSLLLAS